MIDNVTSPGENHVQEFYNRPPIGYAEYGDPAGLPVFAFHGTPGSRFKFRAADQPAQRLGLRIVAPDRRGYGLTAFAKHTSLSDWAYDIAALADALKIDQFAIFGISGGGPYAVACAASLDKRVTALALASPVGPVADLPTGVDWFHRFCFVGLPRIQGAPWLTWQVIRAGFRWAPQWTWSLALLGAPETDRKTLQSPGVEERLSGSFREGLRNGVSGPVQDMALFSATWDFPLEKIIAPARLWLGTKDCNVPRIAALHLAAQIPTCTIDEIDGEGHLWISLHYDVVLSWLHQVSC